MMDKNELQTLVNEGLTQRQIASKVGKSHTSIRYWLRKHNIHTKHPRKYLKQFGPNDPRYTKLYCIHHGESSHVQESRGSYRCMACRSFRQSEARRKLKIDLVAMHGGVCFQCGYNKSLWAFHFHHINPAGKIAAVSELVKNGKRAEAVAEALKCHMLCANCHAEEEERLWVSKNYGNTSGSFENYLIDINSIYPME